MNRLLIISSYILLTGSIFAEDLLVLNKKTKVRAKVLFQRVQSIKEKNLGKYTGLEKLNKQGERIEELLGKFQKKSGVWDFTSQYDFKTGSTAKGILLNSIVSTNLESPLIVEIIEGEKLPSGARLICKGVTRLKRVVAFCDKIVMPLEEDEYEIQASLLNADGSSGLRPDEISTGKEEYVAGTIATAFSKGMIEMGTDRIASPLGELTPNNRRNRITSGLLNSLDETNNIMNSEMKTREPKVYIEAGRPVLIYFNARFKR